MIRAPSRRLPGIMLGLCAGGALLARIAAGLWPHHTDPFHVFSVLCVLGVFAALALLPGQVGGPETGSIDKTETQA